MVATIGLGTIFTGAPASADTLGELNRQNNEIQGQKSQVNQQLNQTTEKIGEIQAEQNLITNEIKRIESEINDTNAQIAEKNQQIEDKNREIEQLKIEIEELKNRIEARNEVLKDRARAYQEGGGFVNYLEVIVGAQSFSDFIDRMSAVATIVEADQTILREHNNDKLELEEKQAAVEQDLAQLTKMQQELESLKSTLSGQQEEQENLMALLEQEKAEAIDMQISLEDERAALVNQEAAIQKAIELEKQKQAELKRQQEEAERKQREEAARKQQEEAARQQQEEAARQQQQQQQTQQQQPKQEQPKQEQPKQSPQPTTTTKAAESNNRSSENTAVKVSSRNFIHPAQGYVSSGFGYRTHPVTGQRSSFHYGIDIAKAGNVPIVAAADGVVTYAGSMGSYGNVIIITHSINGKTYETLYAHLRSIGVGSLQTVSQGQFIGYMGTTGRSTGQHLHFEVHNGKWNGSRSNAINPLSVL